MKQTLARGCDALVIMLGARWSEQILTAGPNELGPWRHAFCLSMVAAALVVFPSVGLYRSWRSRLLSGLFARLLGAWCLIQLSGLMVLAAVGRCTDAIVQWVMLWTFVSALLFVAVRGTFYAVAHRLHLFGLDQPRVAVVGFGAHFEAVLRRLHACHGTSGYAIADEIGYDGVAPHPASERQRLAACLERLTQGQFDEVWVAFPVSAHQRALTLIDSLRNVPALIRYLPDVETLGLRGVGGSLEGIGIPSISVSESDASDDHHIGKALFDKGFSLMVLVALAPLWITIAVIIKATSPGPVLFRQQRTGLNGRKFSIFKFRSMYVHQPKGGELQQATRNDARVTPIGRFLRRTSLDELPQFINVLRGEMSVVGPRPHAIEHDALFSPQIVDYIQRYRVKPGITGWAQVNGYRGETDRLEKMTGRVEYDLYYLNHRSFALDLKIVWLTIFHGFVNRHAY